MVFFGIFAAVLLLVSPGVADDKFKSSFGQDIWIKSQESWPDFTTAPWQKIPEPLKLARGAPITGTYAIGHINGNQLVFEIIIEFRGVSYFHGLVYYLDGRTPRIFLKRSANTADGADVFFQEKLPDSEWSPAAWPPDVFFPNLKERRFM